VDPKTRAKTGEVARLNANQGRAGPPADHPRTNTSGRDSPHRPPGYKSMLLQTASGTREIPDSYLLVAIDETGHEHPDPHHPAFGLGGCAFPAGMYAEWIQDPWRRLKASYFGSPDIPLHAADLRPNDQQAEALGAFFRQGPFGRIAVLTSVGTSKPDSLPDYQLVANGVLERTARLVRHFGCNGAVLIHEESTRTDRLAATYFGGDSLVDSSGQRLPLLKFRMPKSANEPFLEVGDFVMHTAGSQVRAALAGKEWGTRKDFQAVFRTTPEELGQFFEILTAKDPPRS
jgi:hypothetical protein